MRTVSLLMCGVATQDAPTLSHSCCDGYAQVRIHWTGCPNSCGQVQAGEIGIMGAPAKKFDPVSGKNKAAPG